MFGFLIGIYLGLEIYEHIHYTKKQLTSFYERIIEK